MYLPSQDQPFLCTYQIFRDSGTSASIVEAREKILRALRPASRVLETTYQIFRESGRSASTFEAREKILRDRGTFSRVFGTRYKIFR